jgi:hypothetical protein
MAVLASILAFDRILRRPALGMTLDAGVVGVHVVEAAGVKNRAGHWLLHMCAARPVAFIAPDIPLAHFLVLMS